MRIGIGLAALALAAVGACGGSEGDSGVDEATSAAPTRTDLGSVSSVVELRDALVDNGFSCPAWDQNNKVELAAESGTCDDSSVLSTFASAGDLQAQLDVRRDIDKLFVEKGVETSPNLVGPNWILNSPDADQYADALGGTVVSPAG